MNKIIIKGVIISVAIILFLLILFKSRSPFGKSNSSFASEPHKEITKIEFSEGGRRLSLEKEGENWLINGKTETRKTGILFILRVLEEIKIKSPVSAELFETEITGKEIVPVKVKVFEKRKLLKTFLVYKTRSNTYGNIMKIKEGSNPFIVYVPGYEGDIGSGFTLNELFWQPYTLFNLMPSEITSVNFENLADTSSSFSIINKNRHFVLSCQTRDLTGWDSTLVTRYLSYFAWIPFEAWAFEIAEQNKKVIESQQPLYRITVSTTGGRKTVLTLWEKITGENDEKAKDNDRLLGKTQNRDEFFIMRYFDIDPLLKKRSYFFPE
ncbi:MAG: hypothetical protein WC854_10905 [Bacteroidales bacterium]